MSNFFPCTKLPNKCALKNPEIFTTSIIRSVLDVYISDRMKSGILTPILKKGKDKNIPGNYRGKF
jgi:hypothetical protein